MILRLLRGNSNFFPPLRGFQRNIFYFRKQNKNRRFSNMIEFVCIFNWLFLMLKSHLIIVYLSKLKIPLDFTYFPLLHLSIPVPNPVHQYAIRKLFSKKLLIHKSYFSIRFWTWSPSSFLLCDLNDCYCHSWGSFTVIGHVVTLKSMIPHFFQVHRLSAGKNQSLCASLCLSTPPP